MEDKSFSTDNIDTQSNLELNWNSINFLSETAKWAKFLAILGFIACGFLVIFSFFAGAIMSASSAFEMQTVLATGLYSGIITGAYLLSAVLAFVGAYYLYKFSTDVKKGIATNNTEIFTSGLGSLKSYFKFNGILAIIVIAFYILLFFVAMIGLAVAGFAGIY